MAVSPGDPVKPLQSPAAPPPHPVGFGLVGALGGALGGAAAGALGGGLGGSIEAMAAPALDDALLGAMIGAVVWGVAAAVVGALIGRLVGRRHGTRAAFDWALFNTFFAALVSAIEASQAGAASGALAFALGVPLMFGLCLAVSWLAPRAWKLRWLLLAWLVLCLLGEAYGWLWPRQVPPLTPPPDEPVVQLRYATLPDGLGAISVHHWFVEYDPTDGRWHRWELWQDADAGGTRWGHVHKDLLRPDAGVGGGPSQVAAEWRGSAARALVAALADSRQYPYRGRYLAWPGPNSNTYVAWVLRRAGVAADLHPMAVGKDYEGLAGFDVSTTRTGVQAETPLLGLKVGLLDGVEVHFLCFTLGIDGWTPALKTPLGRIGFPD